MYLDDGFSTANSHKQCQENSIFVKSSLLKAGFLPNEEKSIWNPTQICEWLGIIFNAIDKTLSLPQERVFSLICSIDEVLKNFPFFTERALAKITGKIISMSPIIGNISWLMTRSLYLTIEGRLSWDNPLDLRNNVNIFEELKFWRDNVKYLNVRKLLVRLPPRLLAYSDASNDACGAFIVSCDNIISHKMWSSEERSMSSTWR